MEKTVLLVDDLQMFLEIERDFFVDSPVNVVTARNGCEALEVMREKKTDIVFMDLQMPKMDGATCCNVIKKDPLLSEIPIIIVTSSTSESDKDACRGSRCDHYITKPAGREKFLNIAYNYIPTIERRLKRFPCRKACRIRFYTETFEAALYNLSAEGAFVVSDKIVPTNSVVELLISTGQGKEISCMAKVVWTKTDVLKQSKAFGLNFVQVNRVTQNKITHLLQSGR
jgi:CheY-like chemotaxis protein